MRIIAGKWRGKRLASPVGRNVRPTSDRARGALFNVLRHGRPTAGGWSLQGVRVLDAFAGTGSLGLEAVSRGAAHASFLESAVESLAILRKNIADCRAQDVTTVIQGDAASPPHARGGCGLIFIDPPYGKGLAVPALMQLTERGWVDPGAVCCIELGRQDEFEAPGGFERIDDRRYGATRIVMLRSTDELVSRG